MCCSVLSQKPVSSLAVLSLLWYKDSETHFHVCLDGFVELSRSLLTLPAIVSDCEALAKHEERKTRKSESNEALSQKGNKMLGKSVSTRISSPFFFLHLT